MCVGGAIGAHFGWRWAFYVVTPPGILLGLLCFLQRDPRAVHGVRARTRARRLGAIP